MADTVRATQPDAAPAGRTPGGRRSGRARSRSLPSRLPRGGRHLAADLLRALLDDKVVLVALCFIVLVVGSAIFAGLRLAARSVRPVDPDPHEAADDAGRAARMRRRTCWAPTSLAGTSSAG